MMEITTKNTPNEEIKTNQLYEGIKGIPSKDVSGQVVRQYQTKIIISI